MVYVPPLPGTDSSTDCELDAAMAGMNAGTVIPTRTAAITIAPMRKTRFLLATLFYLAIAWPSRQHNATVGNQFPTQNLPFL